MAPAPRRSSAAAARAPRLLVALLVVAAYGRRLDAEPPQPLAAALLEQRQRRQRAAAGAAVSVPAKKLLTPLLVLSTLGATRAADRAPALEEVGDEGVGDAAQPPGAGAFRRGHIVESARARVPWGLHVGPGLTEVEALSMMTGHLGESMDLVMPATWAEMLAPYSCGVLTWDDSADSYSYRATARLSGPGPETPVLIIGSWRPHLRELFMLHRLAETGAAPSVLKLEETPDMSFAMIEWGGELERWMARHDDADLRMSDELRVPLEESLPVMIDLLRALEAMEARDIVHGNLDEQTILVDEDGRGMISDFRAASVQGKVWSQKSLWIDPAGLRMTSHPAPELASGAPPSAANDVWQLGVVFSKLTIGGDGLAAAEMLKPRGWAYRLSSFAARFFTGVRRKSVAEDGDDAKPSMSRRRDLLRKRHRGVYRIIQSMLQESPRRRSSARRARKRLERVARRYLGMLPPPRSSALSAAVPSGSAAPEDASS